MYYFIFLNNYWCIVLVLQLLTQMTIWEVDARGPLLLEHEKAWKRGAWHSFHQDFGSDVTWKQRLFHEACVICIELTRGRGQYANTGSANTRLQRKDLLLFSVDVTTIPKWEGTTKKVSSLLYHININFTIRILYNSNVRYSVTAGWINKRWGDLLLIITFCLSFAIEITIRLIRY